MKTNNTKNHTVIGIFIALFVVICCSVLYKRNYVDIAYLLVVLVYFTRYIYIKRKSIS